MATKSAHLETALEKKKLLQRLPDPVDTRSWLLKLTPHGKEMVKKTLPIVEQVDRDFFAEAQHIALREVLKSLGKKIDIGLNELAEQPPLTAAEVIAQIRKKSSVRRKR